MNDIVYILGYLTIPLYKNLNDGMVSIIPGLILFNINWDPSDPFVCNINLLLFLEEDLKVLHKV